jgi:hypothetical protein
MGRTLVKTDTAGWYEDPEQDGKKVRKRDGDVILDRKDYEAAQRGDTNGAVAEKAKQDAKGTVLSSGKIAKGETVTITCAKRGCREKRVIQVQDKFQVKFCLPHQKEHRNELRRERRKAKAKA